MHRAANSQKHAAAAAARCARTHPSQLTFHPAQQEVRRRSLRLASVYHPQSLFLPCMPANEPGLAPPPPFCCSVLLPCFPGLPPRRSPTLCSMLCSRLCSLSNVQPTPDAQHICSPVNAVQGKGNEAVCWLRMGDSQMSGGTRARMAVTMCKERLQLLDRISRCLPQSQSRPDSLCQSRTGEGLLPTPPPKTLPPGAARLPQRNQARSRGVFYD